MTLNEKLNRIPIRLRKWIAAALGVILFGGTIAGLFLYFYITSRLSYPERNVLYRVNESVTQSINSARYHFDRSSQASISEGGLLGGESMQAGENDIRIKAIMCKSKRREKGDIDEYELLNTTYQKVAQASTKSEKSRDIFDISRSNYIQNVAGLINAQTATEEIKLITLENAPEIASSVDADTYIFDAKTQKPSWRYRLTDKRRYFGLLGDKYRYSTLLYEQKDANGSGAGMQSSGAKNSSANEKNKNLDLIYHSSETGLFGIMPQGSRLYLFQEIPCFTRRVYDYFNAAETGESVYTFKISQFWDAFPWRFMNGGYILSDKHGKIAMIKFEDFWFHYADDVVYHYYLDLDGDGEINETTEIIGKVLFSMTESGTPQDKTEGDINYTINYSFMAGRDPQNAANDFILCGDIEAMMPDQIFDGFGQHSFLGFIEEKRDDIMLYLDRSTENLDRAIKEDDTLGFKTSLLRLLLYSRRPYLSKIAAKFSAGETVKFPLDNPEEKSETSTAGVLETNLKTTSENGIK